MRARNALGLKSGGDRIEARNDRHGYGKRADLAPSRHNRQALPPTAMRDAFLRALLRWAAKGRPGAATKIIPTGVVNADELARVMCAIAAINRRPR